MTAQSDPAPDDDFTAAADPFLLFNAWFAEATRREINDANAMSVATTGTDGLPNVRIVLLKGVDEPGHPARGFVFYTNFEGTKGRELSAHPQAALAFHWKSLERQVRVRGTAAPVTSPEADAYFATRPRQSQIGAWASQQSRPLESRAVFEAAVASANERYASSVIPRPPYWSGWRVTPVEIEFWQARPFRLHDRVVFRRSASNAPWVRTRLYP